MNRHFIESQLGFITTLIFLERKRRYFSNVKTIRPPDHLRGHVDRIKRDGFVVIPDFVSKQTAARMLACVPDESSFEESVEGDRALFYLNAHTLSGFSEFFNSQLLGDIAKAYIGNDVISLRRSIEWRRTKGQVIACDRMYHMDTWKHRLKAFLYLHDVGMDEAPMIYLKGSHEGAWRLPMEARIDARYKTNDRGYAASPDLAFIGCYWPYEVNEFKTLYGLQDVICTGPAGTLIIFDSRGLHRATELKCPYRKLLINYWIKKGNHT